MIEVIIRHTETDVELGRIEIENVGVQEDGETADYSVRFAVEKIAAVGLHQRAIYRFPRKRYNVLALLLQALSSMEEADLEFTGEWEERDVVSKIKKLRSKGWL